MKIVTLSSSFLVILSLAGCNNLTAPRQVVASAYENLLKNNSKAFQKNLTGDALAKYSSPAAVAELQEKLSGLDIVTGKEEQTDSVNMGGGRWVISYTVPVLSSSAAGGTVTQKLLLLAGVECEYTQSYSCVSNPNESDDPTAGCSDYSEFCSINSIGLEF